MPSAGADVRIILSASDKASPVVQSAIQRINASYSHMEDAQGAVTKGFALQHQTLFNTLNRLQEVGHAAETVTGVFMAYNIQQLRQFEIQNRVIDSQYALNEAIQQYGPDSIQAEMAARSLSAAQREQAQAAQEAELQWLAWGTSLLGVAAQVASAVLPRLAAIRGAASAASAAVIAAGASAPAQAAATGAGSAVSSIGATAVGALGSVGAAISEAFSSGIGGASAGWSAIQALVREEAKKAFGPVASPAEAEAPTLQSRFEGTLSVQPAGNDFVNSFNDNSARHDYTSDSTYNSPHNYSTSNQYDQAKSYSTENSSLAQQAYAYNSVENSGAVNSVNSPTTNNAPYQQFSNGSSINPILYNELYQETVRGYNTGYSLIQNSDIDHRDQSSTVNNQAATLNHLSNYDNSSIGITSTEQSIAAQQIDMNQLSANYATSNSPDISILQQAYGFSQPDNSINQIIANNATEAMFPQGVPTGLPVPALSFNPESYQQAFNPSITVNPLLTGPQAAREIRQEQQYYPGYAPPEGVELFPGEAVQQAAIPGYNITVNPRTGEVLYQQDMSRRTNNTQVQYDSNNVDNYNPSDFGSYTNQEMQQVLNSVDQSGDSYNNYEVTNHPFGSGSNVIQGGALPSQLQIQSILSELEQAFGKAGSYAAPAAQAVNQTITIYINGAGQSAQAIANQVKQTLQTNGLYGNSPEPGQSSPARR